MPNSPVTKDSISKEFLCNTPIPNLDTREWKKGVPTPINEGTLSPNQEALGLLAGFASGNVRMQGDVVQHPPVVQGNSTIGDSLQELPWSEPSPEKKRTDGSVI